MAEKFAATIKNWAEKTEVKQTEVWHEALRDLDQEIAENTPVVSGNTKNSRMVSMFGLPPIDWTTKKFRDPSDAINNAIAGIKIGEKAYLGYRAPWAHKLEPRHAMLRLAAQRWVQIVDAAAGRIRGK